MMRRRQKTAGFVMAEALVALAIATMTLVLLTGASWGLRMAAERRAAVVETSAADWLAARRAVTGWAAGVTAAGVQGADARLIGTSTTARMVVAPVASGRTDSFVGELRVEAVSDGIYALIAARHFGQIDARVASDDLQETEVLRTNAPMRLLYLLPREGAGQAGIWRYETGSGNDGLPAAIAIEVGEQRMLTARVFATVSASCLSALGPGGLDDGRCDLR